jgi:transcriptional regulator with XRE-family HTH domain
MSPQRVSFAVKPALLTWAREATSLSTEEAARKLGVKPERLVEWEAGTGRPTVAQLRKAAGLYRRPLAAFFLVEPPARPVPCTTSDAFLRACGPGRRPSSSCRYGARVAGELWRWP